MDIYLFQLMNKDGEHAGLLKTNLTEDVVETAWEEYCKDNEPTDIAEFVEIMSTEHPHDVVHWETLDAIINP